MQRSNYTITLSETDAIIKIGGKEWIFPLNEIKDHVLVVLNYQQMDGVVKKIHGVLLVELSLHYKINKNPNLIKHMIIYTNI
jgi:hypothetical protein